MLRHLRGSRASQLDTFAVATFTELTIGRDPLSSIHFDAVADSVVGRQHARITRDAARPLGFVVHDMDSRNGTFVNRRRVIGIVPLSPGDVIELGAGGPALRFDIGAPPRRREAGHPPLEAAFAMSPRRAGAEHADAVRVSVLRDEREFKERGLFVVLCNGARGHRAGGLAAHLAAELIAHRLSHGSGDVQSALPAALQAANSAVREAARRDAQLHGMGTGCLALVIRERLAVYAHVGGARLYLARAGALYHMTEDRGAPETRGQALGSHTHVTVSGWPQPFSVQPGDRFLLCTDRLLDHVPEPSWQRIATEGAAQTACDQMIRVARQAGSEEPMSVAVVYLREAWCAGAGAHTS